MRILTFNEIQKYYPKFYELTDVAKEHGLEAALYVHGGNEPHAFDNDALRPDVGVYFVVFRDKDCENKFKLSAQKIFNDVDVDDVVSSINYEGEIINTKYAMVPLTEINNENEFYLYQQCVRRIMDLDTAKACYSECGFNPPEYVARSTMDALYSFMRERFNPKLSHDMRILQDNAMKTFVMRSAKRYAKDKPVKHKLFRPHIVDKDYFFKNHIEQVNDVATGGFLKYLKTRWNEYPEFSIYIERKPFQKFKDNTHMLDDVLADHPELEGYCDDLTGCEKYRVAFPAYQMNEYYAWHLDYMLKKLGLSFVVPLDELKKSNQPLHIVEVHSYDLDNFKSLCIANNVKCAVNHGEFGSPAGNNIKFVYKSEDYEMVKAIEQRLNKSLARYFPVPGELKEISEKKLNEMAEEQRKLNEDFAKEVRKQEEREHRINEKRKKKGLPPKYEEPVVEVRGHGWDWDDI